MLFINNNPQSTKLSKSHWKKSIITASALFISSQSPLSLAADAATLSSFLIAENYTILPTTFIQGEVNSSASFLSGQTAPGETVSIIDGPDGNQIVLFFNGAGELVSALESNTPNTGSGNSGGGNSGGGSTGGGSTPISSTEATIAAIADVGTTFFSGNGFQNSSDLERLSTPIDLKEKLTRQDLQKLIRGKRDIQEEIKVVKERIDFFRQKEQAAIKLSNETEADAIKFIENDGTTDPDVQRALEQNLEAGKAGLIASQGLESAQNELSDLQSRLDTINAKINEARNGGLKSKPLNKFTLTQASEYNNSFAGNYTVAESDTQLPWLFSFGFAYAEQDDNRENADINSRMSDITVTAQTLLDNDTTLGFSGTIRQGKVESDNNNSRQDGDYLSLSVSSHRELDNNLVFGGALSFTQGDNDIDVDGNTGSFDVNIVSMSASLSGNLDWNQYQVTPKANMSLSQVKRDAYSDSDNNNIPSSKIKQQQITVGAVLSQQYLNSESFKSLTPSYGAHIGYFSQDDISTTLPNGAENKELGVGINFQAGVDFVTHNDLKANIKTQYGIFDGDASSWSVQGNLSYEF